MCEFCTQHGEGKQWYLNMANYSRELYEQDGREAYMADFINNFEARMPSALRQFEWVTRTPLRRPVAAYLTWQQKSVHHGQVVPIEEVEQILSSMAGVVCLPCVCRRVTTGNQNARYCYGLNMHPRLQASLDDSFNLEILAPEEAVRSVRKLDQEGLVHSVWTFKTPYIGGLCNCDQDCIAYRITHERGYFQNMYRSEYLAAIDLGACNGCRNCLRQCQYGALRFSAANKKVLVDPRACYGCGVCRAACHREAIRLQPRRSVPVAANLW